MSGKQSFDIFLPFSALRTWSHACWHEGALSFRIHLVWLNSCRSQETGGPLQWLYHCGHWCKDWHGCTAQIIMLQTGRFFNFVLGVWYGRILIAALTTVILILPRTQWFDPQEEPQALDLVGFLVTNLAHGSAGSVVQKKLGRISAAHCLDPCIKNVWLWLQGVSARWRLGSALSSPQIPALSSRKYPPQLPTSAAPQLQPVRLAPSLTHPHHNT